VALQRRRTAQESFEEEPFEDSVVQIYRCSKVVKGGRRFNFGALVVVGDRNGHVGIGYGKANGVPQAVEKAIAEGRKKMAAVKLKGTTIPHRVIGHFGATRVLMIPASEGTGVIAGKKLVPLLELAGIHNVLTKTYGSTSPKNLLKAGLKALLQLRTAETVSQLRGVKLDEVG